MTYFLFPGQGSQTPGMARDFYESSSVAKAALDEAAEVAGNELLQTMFEGSAERLKDTRVAQLALVAAEVAIARHLIHAGIRPFGVAGHSVGEISALVIAECLTFPDALRLTRERARFMSEDVPPGGMSAVLGLAPDLITQYLPPGVEVANFNGPDQTIISGSLQALETAAAALKQAGAKRVLPLPVSGPFHSSYMKPAGDRLREVLSNIHIANPSRLRLRFFGHQDNRRVRSRSAFDDLLAQQLYVPRPLDPSHANDRATVDADRNRTRRCAPRSRQTYKQRAQNSPCWHARARRKCPRERLINTRLVALSHKTPTPVL